MHWSWLRHYSSPPLWHLGMRNGSSCLPVVFLQQNSEVHTMLFPVALPLLPHQFWSYCSFPSHQHRFDSKSSSLTPSGTRGGKTRIFCTRIITPFQISVNALLLARYFPYRTTTRFDAFFVFACCGLGERTALHNS